MEFYDGGFVEDKSYMKKHGISVDKVNTVRENELPYKDVHKYSFFPQTDNDLNALSTATIQITDPAAFKSQIKEQYK